MRIIHVSAAAALLVLAAGNKPTAPAPTPPPQPPATAEPVFPPPEPDVIGPTDLADSTSPASLQHLGDCDDTRIAQISPRLEGQTMETGTFVAYENDARQVSYSPIEGAIASKVGDPVRLCVTRVPKDCPVGDDRGFFYRAVNKRNGKVWEVPNAGHECGGA